MFVASASYAAGSTTMPSTPKDEFIFDGSVLSYHYTPVLINKIEFIPLQSFSSILNTEIRTDEASKLLSVETEFFSLKVQVNSNLANLNGEEVELGAYLLKRNGIVYLPLNFAVNVTSDIFAWDLEKNTALFSPGGTLPLDTENASPNSKNLTLNISELNGKLTLVNKWNPMPSNYVPNNLKSVLDNKKRYIVPSKLSNTKMDSDALMNMAVMLKAAAVEGCKDFILSSGYRSFSSQNFYYTNKINFFLKSFNLNDARVKAGTIVAPPGMSEHQTGLAADMTNRDLLKTSEPLVENFSKTAQGKWLRENSWKYGFVIRFQPDKTKFTGIISEPWHLRFVGLPHSEIMYKNNMCLEEYLEYIKKTKYISFITSTNKTYEIYYFNMLPQTANFKLLTDGKSYSDISRYGKNGYIITKLAN